MPNVHSTAIMAHDVQLADDVCIGPWCVIEGPVTIGPGCRLMERVSIRGPLIMGVNNAVYPSACLGFPPQDRKYNPDKPGAGVRIGDNNVLREGVTIHRATGDRPTTVGNDNYLMCAVHLGHDAVVSNRCTLANQVLLAGHVVVQNQVTMGGNAVVHQYCRLGRLVMMSGAMGVVQDIPPFCVVYNHRMVGSLNLVGLRRAGLREHIEPLQRAFTILYRTRHTTPVALEMIDREKLDDPLVDELIEFVRTTKRGITPYSGGSRGDE